MTPEDTLAGWTAPSSDTEQEKQERTERMIREAIAAHNGFSGCQLSIYAKGSYANNTNVRADSDVDVAVQCTEAEYWEESEAGAHPPRSPYKGPWTPQKLRSELVSALTTKFPGQMDADVVPCFSYGYYFPLGVSRPGTKIFTTSGTSIVNYPSQQLDKGRAKNVRTGNSFKKAVRVLKRVENAMLAGGAHRQVPSFFIECIAYNCPDSIFGGATWTAIIRGMLVHIWNALQGDEPADAGRRWLEVSECSYLFHGSQKWTRVDGRDFAQAAWTFLGYTS